MSKLAKLSDIDPEYTYEQVVDLLLDNGYVGIINDIPPPPHIEYMLFDLRVSWPLLKKLLKQRL